MKKKIIWSIAIFTLIVVGGALGWFLVNNQSIAEIPQQTENKDAQIAQNINEQENKILDSENSKTVPSEQDENKVVSYQTGKYTVFYEINNSPWVQDKVTVYLNDGDTTSELFQEVAWSIGGDNPKFQKLKDENIVLLTFGNGDSGWSQKNYHFINVTNKDVISIEDINGSAGLIKIYNQTQDWEISTFIKNECKYFQDGKIKIRDGENSYLTDLTLNDERVNVLTEERILKCVHPYGLGTGLNPDVDLKYLGISKNLSKIFFSLTSTDTVEFAFDINNQTIQKSAPYDLVE